MLSESVDTALDMLLIPIEIAEIALEFALILAEFVDMAF